MKTAKFSLIAAFSMTVLSSVRCVAMLFANARSLRNEQSLAFPKTEKVLLSVQDLLQSELQKNLIHRYQAALYGELAALVWNLLLVGLLAFAISRFQGTTQVSSR